MPAKLGQEPADSVVRMNGVGGEDVRSLALPLFARAGPNADLPDALLAYHVHHPSHRRGVVLRLTEEFITEVRVGVELEDAEVGEGREPCLGRGQGRRRNTDQPAR